MLPLAEQVVIRAFAYSITGIRARLEDRGKITLKMMLEIKYNIKPFHGNTNFSI